MVGVSFYLRIERLKRKENVCSVAVYVCLKGNGLFGCSGIIGKSSDVCINNANFLFIGSTYRVTGME